MIVKNHVEQEFQAEFLRHIAPLYWRVICIKLVVEVAEVAERAASAFLSDLSFEKIRVEILVPSNCMVVDYVGWKKILFGAPSAVDRLCSENGWIPECSMDFVVRLSAEETEIQTLRSVRLAGKTDTGGIVL